MTDEEKIKYIKLIINEKELEDVQYEDVKNLCLIYNYINLLSYYLIENDVYFVLCIKDIICYYFDIDKKLFINKLNEYLSDSIELDNNDLSNFIINLIEIMLADKNNIIS